ncbi:MAG: flagellar basal body rod protein FlgC [Spirochaetaceae bacterium]|jgi:flagellar basal-body rod protein FlgC|nr:flagellar basal body rod protein FlgC [Spirochaetaceae bacterium]
MGLFTSINIASSGMGAQRIRGDVISNNMANVTTTRTNEGGPFRRSRVIMRPRVQQPYWRSPFLPQFLDNGPGNGVRVARVEKDNTTELRKVYDPTHPDRILEGPDKDYVLYPNVDVVTEMVDLIEANRMYEANAQVVEGYKSMFQRALEIGGR